MDLTKHLSNEVTAHLSEQGVLTLTERLSIPVSEGLVMDGPPEEELVTTTIALSPQAVRALLNFLLRNIVRSIIGHRKWQGSKPDRKGK